MSSVLISVQSNLSEITAKGEKMGPDRKNAYIADTQSTQKNHSKY